MLRDGGGERPAQGVWHAGRLDERGKMRDEIRGTRARQRFRHDHGRRSADALHLTHHEVVAGTPRAAP